MVNSTSQNKSPYILLLLLSVLVISTLVVASLYFIRPNLETELEHRVSDNLEKAGIDEAKLEVAVSGRDAVITGQVESLAVAKKVEKTAKETCGVRFIDNQLLVKNTH